MFKIKAKFDSIHLDSQLLRVRTRISLIASLLAPQLFRTLLLSQRDGHVAQTSRVYTWSVQYNFVTFAASTDQDQTVQKPGLGSTPADTK